MPDTLNLMNMTWYIWSRASMKPSLVVVHLSEEILCNDSKSDLFMEALINHGFNIFNIEIHNLFRRNKDGRKVVSSSISISSLDDSLINLICRKGWISVNHRIYSVRRFVIY